MARKKCPHGHKYMAECKICKHAYYLKYKRDEHAKILWMAARSRARNRGIPFTIKQTDVVVPTHCAVLGIPLDCRDRNHTPSIDEVVQGKGYTPGNIAVISGKANRIKSDATLKELQAIELYVRLRIKSQNM